MACFFGTNDEQAKYMAKAEANAMERIRYVAKEAASKVEQMMVSKAMEQAKRKEFEAIERNEYDEIMNAQEDADEADEAKYGKQAKREPLILDRSVKQMRESYEFLFSLHEELNSEAWLIGALDMRKRYEDKITSGELIVNPDYKP